MQSSTFSHTDLTHCASLKNQQTPFILVLKHGDNLFTSLLDCANRMSLVAASFNAIGAVADVTLAYYDLATQQYKTQVFPGDFELVSLVGNITTVDEAPFLHIHAAIGDSNFQVFGGHVMEATVGATTEIAITPLSASIPRQLNTDIGLKLICPLDR
jgi:predicted DNA-binding protein with PD1-like motif